MPRKTLTQLFPFLLPARLWHRKRWYYLKMRLDANRYARRRAEAFPCELFGDRSLLINEHTGADIRYQYNKAHNLRLAFRTISHVVIEPGETFSVWWLARHADRDEPYKDGLCVHNGKLVAVYGGGLCQLSNLLFWLFLHSPLTIVERHMHKVKEFPNPSESDPCGVDATILEGWLDLRARNDTDMPIQIVLDLDDRYCYGRLLTPRPYDRRYAVANRNLHYFRRGGRSYESVEVVRQTLNAQSGRLLKEDALYTNVCEIGYAVASIAAP